MPTKNKAPTKRPPNTAPLDHSNLITLDSNLQFYGLWSGSLILLVLTLILGPTGAALFFLAAGGLAYMIYQKEVTQWMNNNEFIIPIALGFYIISGFNLIGLGAGILAGYFINLQYQRGKNLATSVANSTHAVRHPIDFTKKKATGMWQGVKKASTYTFGWLMQDEQNEQTPIPAAQEDNTITLNPERGSQKIATTLTTYQKKCQRIKNKDRTRFNDNNNFSIVKELSTNNTDETIQELPSPHITPAFKNASLEPEPTPIQPAPQGDYSRPDIAFWF